MRWVWLTICAILGLVMFICGWLVPVHLRAVDANVIKQAGRHSTSLVQAGLTLLGEKKLGAAGMFLKAATAENIPDREKLGLAGGQLRDAGIRLALVGWLAPRLENLFGTPPPFKPSNRSRSPRSSCAWTSRDGAEVLRNSPRPLVQELLRLRALTNTVLFPPCSRPPAKSSTPP